MTSYSFDNRPGYYGGPSVFIYSSSLENEFVYNTIAMRPVIVLKGDIPFIGDGTIDSPYEIVTE